MSQPYDVIIIGSGVIGSAIARELSRFRLRIAVLEKELDVCSETSSRNSGVVHAGFNNKPGSLMARFCVEGCLKFPDVARELDIPFKQTGKLVVGFDEDDLDKLKALKKQGDLNSCPDLAIIGKNQIQALAPEVGGEFALYSPHTGVINPFMYTVALAENAHQNGAEFFFDHEVTGIIKLNTGYQILTTQTCFETKWVINAAGLHSDRIARMLGVTDYTIYPCRGEYFILDKKVGALLTMPAYPVPNAKAGGLGIHLTTTVDGNIMIGPSAEYIGERDDYASTKSVMEMLIADGGRIFPHLRPEHIIRSFSGIRPKLVGESQGGYADFVIEMRPEIPFAINLVGIESPGLTSSLPIARYVTELLGSRQDLIPKPDFDPIHRSIPRFSEQSQESQRELIAGDPNYGEIICRCEVVTKAEILAAIRNPLGVETISGIKNRTRAMTGRCQGGYCQTRIAEILMAEKGRDPAELLYDRKGSWLFTGKVREI